MKKKLPNNWVKVPLQDIVEILDNKRKPISAKERAKRLGDVPYYGATGIAGFINNHIFDEELVLLGEDGAPFFDKRKNVAYLIKGKSWVNNHAHVLRAKEGITCNKFILFFLNMFDYTDFVGGTTRLKLTQGDLRKIPISLPPRPEQDRMVAKLDRLFEQLDTINESLEKIPVLLKNFRQQMLTQAVTGKLTEEWRKGKELDEWKPVKMNNIVSSIQAGKNFTCPEIPVEEGEVGLVKISAVTWNKFNPKKTKTVKDPEKINPEYFIKSGDFLMSRANTLELVGASVIVDQINYDIMISDKVWRINFIEDNDKYFIDSFLKSSKGRFEIESRATGNQLSMRNLSQKNFKDIDILLPSSREKEEVVRKLKVLLKQADRVEAQYNKLKKITNKLPQAILHKAFKGELVPQLESDGDARELLEQIKNISGDLVKKASDRRKKMAEFNENFRGYVDNEEDLSAAAESDSNYKENI